MSINPDQFGGPGGQGRLFMTAQEVRQGYEPWPADRNFVLTKGLPGTKSYDDPNYRPSVHTGQDFDQARDDLFSYGHDIENLSTTGGTPMMDYGDEETDDMLYARKLEEARDHGLDWDIEQEGIKNPVRLMNHASGGTIVDGHHRLAVAHDMAPDTLVPVLPASSFWDPSVRPQGGPPRPRYGIPTGWGVSDLR